MYIEVRVQWTIYQNAFTIINSDHIINNNNYIHYNNGSNEIK